MPKGRRSRPNRERGTRRTPRPNRTAFPAHDFDEAWFHRYREFSRARYVDLTRIEDRRRWHPDMRWPTFPRGLTGLRTRILVVPDRHPLAKFQTYGGKYRLGEVFKKRGRTYAVRSQQQQQYYDKYGGKYFATQLGVRTIPKRIGFHMPWQVIVCVRRRRRREVLHALRIAGGRGAARARKHRTSETEVVC